MNSIRHFPLGTPFPQSPHAVVSSLPTMDDVRGYEEKDPRVLNAMDSGYPRFVVHRFIRELIDFYLERESLLGRAAFLIPGRRAARALSAFIGESVEQLEVDTDVWLVYFNAEDSNLAEQVRKYVQHVGCGISSRQAEDLLLLHGCLTERFEEETSTGNSLLQTEQLLADQIGCRTKDVLVCASGMNAFYAGFRAVQEFQYQRGRKRWLQLGWLYLDSGCILKEFLREDESLDYCYDVFELDRVLDEIRSCGEDLAAVVVECPTNPLIQVCDLEQVAKVVREQGGVMIVDPTIASIYNVDVLPFTDLLVTSLTKYAATEGDVMIGALAVNPDSKYYGDLVLRTSAHYQPAYGRDVARLAYQMPAAPELVATMNRNAARLALFLSEHPAVEAVFYAGFCNGVDQVARSRGSYGAVVSVRLKAGMEAFYDAIALMKGPSFGASFTLLCPFMYLAHYDLVSSEEGRVFLDSVGIDPELIRISLGTESYEEIEKAFADALQIGCLN